MREEPESREVRNVQPEDQGQPGNDQESRSITLRLSRDTLLLLGALLFLIFAVGLVFLFPPAGSNSAATPAPTVVAIGETVAALLPTAGATTPPAPGSPQPPAPIGAPGYPAPGAAPGTLPLPSPTPFTDNSPQPSPEITATTGSGVAAPRPTDAYPVPVGTAPVQPAAGTNQPAPTFSPSRPTSAQPQPTFPPPPGAATSPVGGQQNTAVATLVRPTTQNQATTVPAPTNPPVATNPPAPTPLPQATEAPTAEQPKEPGPVQTVPPSAPAPTSRPADVLQGNVRWSLDQSPIVLRRDVQLAPGANLIIEPGVEVRLDPGVAIFVDNARFLALGLPERPIRIVGNQGLRWNGLYGLPGSAVVLENAEVQGGGVGGTVVAVERGEFTARRTRFTDNGGTILLTDSKVEVRDSEIAGNDMPYSAALDATYSRGGANSTFTLTGSRIGGNRLSEGAPGVRVTNQSNLDLVSLDIQGNLIRNGVDNLVLSTNGPLRGTVACNTLISGNLGFSLRAQTVQLPASPELSVVNNWIDDHTPPIIPVYLDFGIGRGAASELPLDMRNNWWGEASGPYHPESNPQGRGDSVGANITYGPWLNGPPACAPQR